MRFELPLLGVVALVAAACGSRASKYPAPTYEEPVLPKWEPSEPEEDDPFANLDEMEGEWVTDEEEGESDGDAKPVEEPGTESDEVEGAGEKAPKDPAEDGPPVTPEDSDAEGAGKQQEEPGEPPAPDPEPRKK